MGEQQRRKHAPVPHCESPRSAVLTRTLRRPNRTGTERTESANHRITKSLLSRAVRRIGSSAMLHVGKGWRVKLWARGLMVGLGACVVLAAGCASVPQQPPVPTSSSQERIAPEPSGTPEPQKPNPIVEPIVMYKPVIYLYPPRTTAVSVQLDVDGEVTVTDPRPDATGTWHVIANPSGDLVEIDSGKHYPYLFWEADVRFSPDLSSGTVVQGSETRAYLSDVLAQRGLNPSEAAAFIEYWVPRMEASPYNLIRFEGDAYERVARLHVTPQPDTQIRVFMVFQPLSHPIAVRPQKLPDPPARKGFVLVEWGGTQLSGR